LFFEGGREASGVMEGVNREEVRLVELRERINRLKERGWKRERFNPERYQVLCGKALVEVGDGV
jgi:DNA polymerase IIIc chi subunit